LAISIRYEALARLPFARRAHPVPGDAAQDPLLKTIALASHDSKIFHGSCSNQACMHMGKKLGENSNMVPNI
jgi:hypothetical protein